MRCPLLSLTLRVGRDAKKMSPLRLCFEFNIKTQMTNNGLQLYGLRSWSHVQPPHLPPVAVIPSQGHNTVALTSKGSLYAKRTPSSACVFD